MAAGTTVSTTATISICPSRIVNPTYTPPAPLPTDFTWGCPPGFLCHPRNGPGDGNCNFEAGPPAVTFFCSPDECIPSPKLLPNKPCDLSVSPDDICKFNVTPGYFNLNPTEFGLNYGIFAFPEGIQVQERSLRRWGRRAEQIPGVCYEECNSCMLEAEAVGKTPALCQKNSAFEIDLGDCNACISRHSTGATATGSLPEFQQFLSYCQTIDTVVTSPAPDTSGQSSTTTKPPKTSTTEPSNTSTTKPPNVSLSSASSATTSTTSRVVSSIFTESSSPFSYSNSPSLPTTNPNQTPQSVLSTTSSLEISSPQSSGVAATGTSTSPESPLFTGAASVNRKSPPMHRLLILCVAMGFFISVL
jgi:hypothetical protein